MQQVRQILKVFASCQLVALKICMWLNREFGKVAARVSCHCKLSAMLRNYFW